MKKKLRFLITIALLLVLAVLLYYHFSNKSASNNNSGSDDTTTVSEVNKILSKNLETNYPLTPREVVNLFTRIQKCYYNVDCSPDDLVALAFMATKLFDTELSESNPFDEYYSELKDDISDYKDKGQTISRVIVDKSGDVIYSTINEVKYASLNCIYYIKDNSTTQKTVETYVLRKDDEGNWKILGWKLYEESEE